MALESTIISHGMPYPRNLEVAKHVEQTIRDFGAVPATIAIIDGIPKVGLTEKDLLILASAKNSHSNPVLKASTKDLAYVYATKATASTTVASTMRIASMAGIDVFATGGIGGVHRGAESSFDISADLIELSRTSVTVVCAGIKSILDIPKTLEVLETHSVPVVSYDCDEFPAFYTNESGVRSTMKVTTALEVASMMAFSKKMRLPNGMVVGVPNPDPASSEKINYAINFALTSAKTNGIKGADITPYILDKIEQLTEGASLDANISLIVNNAKVAAQIAVEHCKLVCGATTVIEQSNADRASESANHSINIESEPEPETESIPVLIVSANSDAPPVVVPTPTTTPTPPTASISTSVASTIETNANEAEAGTTVLVAGAALIDIVSKISVPSHMGSSNPGRMSTTFGGVGYNIASILATLGRRGTRSLHLISLLYLLY